MIALTYYGEGISKMFYAAPKEGQKLAPLKHFGVT